MTNQELETVVQRLEEAGTSGEVRIESVDDEAVQTIPAPSVKVYPAKAEVLYTGNSGRRTVDEYEWNADNGFVQTVEGAALIERLLRNGDFVIVERKAGKK